MRFIGMLIISLIMGGTAFAQQRDKVSNISRAIRFYPNPATTFIQFEIPSTANKETVLEVYNFLGKKMIYIPTSLLKVRIDLNPFTRGIYIYQWKDRSGKIIESGKFQVEK